MGSREMVMDRVAVCVAAEDRPRLRRVMDRLDRDAEYVLKRALGELAECYEQMSPKEARSFLGYLKSCEGGKDTQTNGIPEIFQFWVMKDTNRVLWQMIHKSGVNSQTVETVAVKAYLARQEAFERALERFDPERGFL